MATRPKPAATAAPATTLRDAGLATIAHRIETQWEDSLGEAPLATINVCVQHELVLDADGAARTRGHLEVEVQQVLGGHVHSEQLYCTMHEREIEGLIVALTDALAAARRVGLFGHRGVPA